MKLQVNPIAKTIAFEGECNVNQIFNVLMSWFPEDWEKWTFVQPTTSIKEVIIEKEIWKNPYWSPYKPNFYYTTGVDASEHIVNPCYVTSAAPIAFNLQNQ